MLHIDPLITAYLVVLAALCGAVMGSFLNCLAWRVVHKENILKGRSHCTSCGHALGILDLFPVFSWLFLGGKCRYCKTKVSVRYPLTELFMAVVYVSLLFKFDVTPDLLKSVIFCSVLFVCSMVDLEIYEIPDRAHLILIAVWIVFLFTGSDLKGQFIKGIVGGLVIAGSMLVLSLIYDKIKGRETLGGGDIKLFFDTGLYLGLAVNFFCLILTCFIGLLFAAVFSRFQKNSEDPAAIPLGPSIALAAWMSLLAGLPVMEWYFSLF